MRKFLYLIAALIFSGLLGGFLLYISVEIVPCQWFGTGFEGACAYGVIYTSMGIGIVIALLCFTYLCYRIFRKN